MKIENIIKSLMIAGLLAGATEANAATKNVKLEGDCAVVTVENKTDRAQPWNIYAHYTDCATSDVLTSPPILYNETSVIKVNADSDFSLDQGDGNGPRWRKFGITKFDKKQKVTIECTGKYTQDAACATK